MAQRLYLRVLTPMERKTSLVGSVLSQRRFHGVDLSDSVFENALCDGIIFDEVNLQRAAFNGACLRYSRFVRCDLSGAQFCDADVASANFLDCIGLSEALRDLLVKHGAFVCAGVAVSAASMPQQSV